MQGQEEPIRLDPLFVGLTRPTMIWGVAFEGVLVGVLFSAIFFLATGNPFYILVCIPIHAVFYAMSLKDPRIFELMALQAKAKARCANRKYWKVNSYSPFVSRKNKQRNT